MNTSNIMRDELVHRGYTCTSLYHKGVSKVVEIRRIVIVPMIGECYAIWDIMVRFGDYVFARTATEDAMNWYYLGRFLHDGNIEHIQHMVR